MSVAIPHFSLPLRVDRGRAVVVEQDAPSQIGDCVEAAARTRLGWRIEAPDFGVPAYVMAAGGADAAELQAALVRSEPRAAVIAELVETLDELRTESIRILFDEGI